VPFCSQESYVEQETIYKQGERAEKLYLIVEGSVALARLFRWTALIPPHVHTVSAICQRPTGVIAIDGAGLKFVLQKDVRAGFETMQNLASVLADRLRAVYSTLDKQFGGMVKMSNPPNPLSGDNNPRP